MSLFFICARESAIQVSQENSRETVNRKVQTSTNKNRKDR